VRKVTQNIVGVISLGVLAASWSIGQAAESGLVVGAPAEPSATETATPTSTPTGSPSSEPATSSTPATSASAKPTPAPSKSAAPVAAAVTKKSDPITYVAEKRQGVMQISVTKKGSAITAIDIISGGTEGGEYASVPGVLAQAAISAQGSNFGNISRATHTTEAFKKALETALAKF
jgi:uncharacterized protein with FMN-binding domain